MGPGQLSALQTRHGEFAFQAGNSNPTSLHDCNDPWLRGGRVSTSIKNEKSKRSSTGGTPVSASVLQGLAVIHFLRLKNPTNTKISFRIAGVFTENKNC